MKTRIVHTRFWEDSYVENLSSKEKLLFIYLLTNNLVNLIGIYEISDKRIGAATGLTLTDVKEIKIKLQKDGKFLFLDGWVKILNFQKYNSQYTGSKNEVAAKKELELVPQQLKVDDLDRLSIDYRYPIDSPMSDSPINHKSLIINHKEGGMGETKPDKKYNNPSWLKNIPSDEMEAMAQTFGLKASTIQAKADSAYDWWEQKPDDKSRKGRNWKATLTSWIRSDLDNLKLKETGHPGPIIIDPI